MREKSLDHVFIALEEHPLSNPPRCHKARLVKRGQMSRNGGLGHTATPLDLAGAYAILQRKCLRAEACFRLLQPREDLAAYGVGQSFMNGIDVHETQNAVRIVTRRTIYRKYPICKERRHSHQG